MVVAAVVEVPGWFFSLPLEMWMVTVEPSGAPRAAAGGVRDRAGGLLGVHRAGRDRDLEAGLADLVGGVLGVHPVHERQVSTSPRTVLSDGDELRRRVVGQRALHRRLPQRARGARTGRVGHLLAVERLRSGCGTAAASATTEAAASLLEYRRTRRPRCRGSFRSCRPGRSCRTSLAPVPPCSITWCRTALTPSATRASACLHPPGG